MRKILAIAIIMIFATSLVAHAGLFSNKKITDALNDGRIKIGMTQEELVSQIGYPPSGRDKKGGQFYRFAQSKVTANGKEDSWTYQVGATMEGVKSITFKMVDGKLVEWNEWLDTKK